MSYTSQLSTVLESEPGAPTTADGVQISKLKPGTLVYFRCDQEGPWEQYKFLCYDAGQKNVRLGVIGGNSQITTDPSHCSVARPTDGLVLETVGDMQAYALLRQTRTLDEIPKQLREAIQVLLELQLEGIDPEALFQSLTIESPSIEDLGTLNKEQRVFIHDDAGAYIAGTFDSIDPDYGRIHIRMNDGSTEAPQPQHVHTYLPEGKRACETRRQLDIFRSYIRLANRSDTFERGSSSRQLILAGLAMEFLKA